MSAMQTSLRTLPFFQVLLCVTMKSKAERVFAGTEGGSVDIDCPYPDGYQYTPQYFCHHPCYSVLIQSTKADEVTSKGRYTAVNTVSTRSFSVTIRNLKLTDSGVYYCGYNKWGIDKLTKVKVTVSKAPVTSTHVPMSRQDQNPEVTELPGSTTVTPTTAGSEHVFDNSTSFEQTSNTTHSGPSTGWHVFSQGWIGVCGGLLGVLMCFALAALVLLYGKQSNIDGTSLKPPAPETQISVPPPVQEDIYQLYDELFAVYSLAGPAKKEDSSAIYSSVQFPTPAEDDCSPYSLVAPH